MNNSVQRSGSDPESCMAQQHRFNPAPHDFSTGSILRPLLLLWRRTLKRFSMWRFGHRTA